MYQQIASNRRKSWLLILIFIGVFGIAGYAYGLYSGLGYSALIFPVFISLTMSAVSWYAGDRIALSLARAHQIERREQYKYVWNLVENLSITAGIVMPKIYIIDDQALNAFATGRDPAHASIALTIGIVEALENEELEGVIAHELSHIQNYDTRLMMLIAVLVGSLALIGQLFWQHSFFGNRNSNEDKSGFGGIFMLVGLVFLIFAPVIGELIKLAVSRRREYLADAGSALLTRYPEGLAKALEKIRDTAKPLKNAQVATAHLWISSPLSGGSKSSIILKFFSTHPPINDRIRELRGMI